MTCFKCSCFQKKIQKILLCDNMGGGGKLALSLALTLKSSPFVGSVLEL